MELEIRPDPSPQEREAIELALRRLLAGPSLPPAYRSVWRQQGIQEAIQATVARPRKSFGATRA